MGALFADMEPAVIVSLIVAVIAAAVSVFSAISARQSAVHVAVTAHTVTRIDADSEELRTAYKAVFVAYSSPYSGPDDAAPIILELEMLRASRAVTPRLDVAVEKCRDRIGHDPHWELVELRDAYREAQSILAEQRADRLASSRS